MPELSLPDYVEAVSECSGVRHGWPLPFGAWEYGEGVNFAFFSRHATRVRLELFDQPSQLLATKFFELDPIRNRTGDVWHIWIRGIRTGQLYGYRVDGPHDPGQGHRFDFNKLLLDPYATALSQLPDWDFTPAREYDSAGPASLDDAQAMPKCIFFREHFQWHADRPPRHPWGQTIIYETHVRGFTIDPSSQTEHPGTYRGLMEKIPYLKELGVTAVELMPVQEFNASRIDRTNPVTGKLLSNYWGYDPVVFFAVKGSYSSAGGMGQQKLEFKELVRTLHQEGIEVILDVVFTHTAEGDERGPTLCFRGIDNSIFYALAEDKRHYRDFTGTGNSINANHPVVCDHILDALRYWVVEMHVDGFRFDLASVLGRDNRGNLQSNPPLLSRIAEDPILRETKLIAEAWDVGGAYEVGSFSHRRWAEWNGRYRDDVRRFWRGDAGMLGIFASRIGGSSDIYAKSGKGPECSINFITSHDGFTLNDLVTYRDKHNDANGENNRDGLDVNFSDNYGIEGETKNPAIESTRKRQIKNFLLTLLISRGVPMLLGGDEFRRSQQGNNNPYCQDNETSWYDWNNLKQHEEIHRFTRRMIAFRKAHPILSKEQFYTDQEIRWFDTRREYPDWNNSWIKAFACQIQESQDSSLYVMFNASGEAIDFTLPSPSAIKAWHLAFDTSQDEPEDALAPIPSSLALSGGSYRVEAHSSVILLSQPIV